MIDQSGAWLHATISGIVLVVLAIFLFGYAATGSDGPHVVYEALVGIFWLIFAFLFLEAAWILLALRKSARWEKAMFLLSTACLTAALVFCCASLLLWDGSAILSPSDALIAASGALIGTSPIRFEPAGDLKLLVHLTSVVGYLLVPFSVSILISLAGSDSTASDSQKQA